MTEAETTLAELDGWTMAFENATADARISEEAERDVAHAVRLGREAWAAYVAATGGEPDPDVRDRTPAVFFGA
ncbi:MAG: hypothetical protein ABIY70_25905 [Capsulimonas sp.]|uniref:hypothetical protein n=1 Tax=Capsulimonas sp. TaxID=2494211 RepID=UPI0032660AFD